MTFKDAVSLYLADPTKETLYSVAAKLCAKLKPSEKLHMLAGHKFFLRNGYDLLTKGQKYNCRPCLGGGVRRLGIPPIAFSDGPRGVVMGNSTCFPVSMARGAAFDDQMEYEIGSAIADEVTAQKGNYYAGICINLLRNPRWGRAQETYGEDPYLLSRMGVALTRAVQDKGVIACPKHFAVNSIENVRFDVNVLCDEKTLHEVYLPHFKACIDAGAMSIMGAYNLYNGDHCCESKHLLKDILRDQWGFEGFTISDFLMGVRCASKALNAGMDMEMPQLLRYTTLRHDIKKGKTSWSSVDDSVQSILRGLIKITHKLSPAPRSVIACERHTALARRAAVEGTVLLKNDGILPLSTDTKIGIIGRYAAKKNVGDHGSSSVFAPYVVTPYQGLSNLWGKDKVVLSKGVDYSSRLAELKQCAAVVVCVGSDYRQEGENLSNRSKSDKVTERTMGGDRYSLSIPKNEVELIRNACRDFDKVIVNIIGGSAYVIEEWKDLPAAILHSFYGGMEGGNALAELLCGKENPSGHLPFTIARDEGDYPDFLFPGDKTRDITYGYYHGYTLLDKLGKKAAYPFGFGLSYTTFEYSDASIDEGDEDYIVNLSARNCGDRDGKTVVQIYVGAEGDHPVKTLKAFKKVFVPAGQTINISIPVLKKDLRFYDPDTRSWYMENSYRFYVGQDCENVTLIGE